MLPRLLIALALVGLSTTRATGHEFWIDPVEFLVPSGDPVVADIRVGQDYAGPSYGWLPRNFQRFEIASGSALAPVEGRMGDRPAVNQPVAAGLAVILHVTADSTVSYTGMEKFEEFVRHKDAAWVLEAHRAEGFPEDKFKEAYSRYAKSLVAVGDGAGADRRFGLLTEIVALANPYTETLPDGLPIQLFYQDAPRVDAQIEVFRKDAEGAVDVFTVRTDSEGRVTIPTIPGARYMLDAVVLRAPSTALAEEKGVIWESLWANLTFQVPR